MRDRYARAGIIHMLSISGLHVAIIASAVLLLLRLARFPPSVATLGSLVVTAVYVGVIGAPPPALRSAAMLGMASGVEALAAADVSVGIMGRRRDRAAGSTAHRSRSRLPAERRGDCRTDRQRSSRSPSFSRHAFPAFVSVVGRELLTSIVATIVSAPLVTWYFGRLSIIAPLANLAAGPVISVLQPTLFLALVCAPVPAVAHFIAAAAHPLLRAFDGIATVAAAVPGSSVQVAPTLVAVIGGSVAVASLLVAGLSRYPGRPLVVAATAMAVVAWAPRSTCRIPANVELHVLDVGQGDAILLRTDKGRWLLFDAGRIWDSGDAGRSTVIPYVMRRGGSLEVIHSFPRALRSRRRRGECVPRAASPHFLGCGVCAGQRGI